MELFVGILFGVGLTLFGIWITEYFKNQRQKTKFKNALYQEILYNMTTAKANFDLFKIKRRKKYEFFAFHTNAFENFKQGILLDEVKHKDFLENLYKGYALIEWFNWRMIEFEKDLWSGDGEIFKNIKKYLELIRNELQNKIKVDKL